MNMIDDCRSWLILKREVRQNIIKTATMLSSNGGTSDAEGFRERSMRVGGVSRHL